LTQHRDRILTAILLLAGATLGTVLASVADREMHLKAAQGQLDRYAQRTLQTADTIAQEIRASILAVDGDKLPFCSDQDLFFMRRLIYKASYVRDMGRIKDGRLYCTSAMGRIANHWEFARRTSRFNRSICTPATFRSSCTRLF
jgi:sensor c-di-GMP phosphodiesterase-like protein